MNYDAGSPEHLTELRRSSWTLRKFTTRPGLSERATGILHRYDGQPYDPKRFEFLEDAWEHDHCVVCGRMLIEDPYDDAVDTGYTDGKAWLCIYCFEQHLAPKNENT